MKSASQKKVNEINAFCEPLPIYKENQYTKMVHLRLTENQHSKVEKKAYINKMSISKYIRFLIDSDIKIVKEAPIDSKEYIADKYKRLYKKLENDHANLKIKCTRLENEKKVLQNKIAKEDKIELPVSYQRIKDIVNEYFNVDIDVKVRIRPFVIARVVYYQIMRSTTQLSYRAIADTLNLRQDHATLISSLGNHSDWIEFDKQYKKDFNAIMEILNTKDETSSNND
jgi:chromosomal replication initiation ATPase DnaA